MPPGTKWVKWLRARFVCAPEQLIKKERKLTVHLHHHRHLNYWHLHHLQCQIRRLRRL